MDRRTFLGAVGATGTVLAGCLGGPGTDAETPTSTVDPDALPAPHLGGEESSVVVRVWEDFQCPHCRRYNEVVLPELREQYLSDDRVRYEHHDFPIPVGEWSWPTAGAARAVQAAAGTDAFWTFADGAYARQDDLGWSTIHELAGEAGADPETVEEQASSGQWRPVLEADKRTGRDRGVDGTPAVFVGDEEIAYGDTYDEFADNVAAAIDERLDG